MLKEKGKKKKFLQAVLFLLFSFLILKEGLYLCFSSFFFNILWFQSSKLYPLKDGTPFSHLVYIDRHNGLVPLFSFLFLFLTFVLFL